MTVQIPRLSEKDIGIPLTQQNQQSVNSNSAKIGDVPKGSSETLSQTEEIRDFLDVEVPPSPPASTPSGHNVQDLINTLESPQRSPAQETTKPLVNETAEQAITKNAGHEIIGSESDDDIKIQTNKSPITLTIDDESEESEHDPYEPSSGSIVDDPSYVPASDSSESETGSGSVEYGAKSVDGRSEDNDGDGEEESGEEEEENGHGSENDGGDEDEENEDERNTNDSSKASSGEEEDAESEGIVIEGLSSDHPSDEDGSTDSQLSEYWFDEANWKNIRLKDSIQNASQIHKVREISVRYYEILNDIICYRDHQNALLLQLRNWIISQNSIAIERSY